MALAFAGKAVAVPAISAIVRKSFDYLEKYTKAEGMRSAKERLERSLPQVQLVFDAIDTEQIKDQSEALDAWLWQLRDAVEEAEDVLDEVEYYKIEEQLKTRGNKVSRSLYKCKRTLAEQFNTTFMVGTFKRLMDAVKKLAEVAVGVERFILLVNRLDGRGLRHRWHQEVGNPRETSSFLVDETVIGRDTEKDQMVEWLIKQDHDACSVAAFAIAGMGGMGKTTLAQAVYCDQRVKQCFDQAMWVCVSDDFDVHTLTKKIIQEFTREDTGVSCLNTLQEILKEKLSSKKFLLVFDDVWNDERRPEWEKLVAPFKFGQKGSKILLTTRMQSVVDIVEKVVGGIKSLRLEGLPDNELLTLFNKHAFFGVNPDDYMDLQEIGKQIIKKLSGSPLAAKVMGGLLNNSMDSVSWNRILRKNICDIQHGDEGVMKVLRLSYYHLPPHLQACFRYCSIFGEDYEFRKEELVGLWMGSGLIQISADENRRPEDVGESYLRILMKKSFFELRSYERHYSGQWLDNGGESGSEYYVMHDLLHELACTVSRKECVRVISGHHGIDTPKTVRHINVIIVNRTLFTDFSQLKRLRTLLISFNPTIDERDQWLVLKKVLKVASKLRVLHVDRSSLVKLPDAFGNLMHLRYLYHDGWFREARKYYVSVYKLYHLQMMALDGCLLVSGRLSNLVNLRHIHPYGYQLGYRDDQIGYRANVGRLTSLQDLNVDLKYNRISELKELKDLRELHVVGIENVIAEEATLAKLAEKENLIMLSLTWGDSQREATIPERVVDNLQPHTNLAKLHIEGYNGSKSPCWMDNAVLINLTCVSLSRCHNWQHLPPLDRLHSLKYLYLRDMSSIKKIDGSFYGCQDSLGFSSLKILSIDGLPELEQWVEVENMNLFPQLTALFVTNCKKLRNIPALPSTLAYLKLYAVGLETFPAMYRSNGISIPPKSSLLKLRIHKCPNLVTIEEEHFFLSLEKLSVWQCENLLHLPIEQSLRHPFLKSLAVEDCPKLMVSHTEVKLSLSIKKLSMGLCGACEGFLLNSAYGLASLTTLQLYDCVITALPSSEVFRRLTALQYLDIKWCNELVTLDGIEELASLTGLRIMYCDKLDKLLGAPLQQMCEASDHSQVGAVCPLYLGKLDNLRVTNPFILYIEPLRRVNSVRYLTIDNCRCLPEEWLMQNCSNLQHLELLDAAHLEFLPPVIANLTSLKTLELVESMLIQSLPDLPASLQRLQILGCHPKLKTRCRKRRGHDWHKIVHIPDVLILQDKPRSYTSFIFH